MYQNIFLNTKFRNLNSIEGEAMNKNQLLEMLHLHIDIDARRIAGWDDFSEDPYEALPKVNQTFHDYYEGHLAALQMVKIWIESSMEGKQDEKEMHRAEKH